MLFGILFVLGAFALCNCSQPSLNIGFDNFTRITSLAKAYLSDRNVPVDLITREDDRPVFDRGGYVLESLECDACLVVVEALRLYVEEGKTEEEIVELATTICIDFKIEDKTVCRGIVREFKNEFIGVLTAIVVNPMDVCAFAVGDECGNPYNPDLNWNVTLPSTKKPPVAPPVLPKKGSPTLRFLHITDVHFDLWYIEDSNAECGEPICCRRGDGTPAPGVHGAGKWGDYRGCDLPLRTLVNLLEHLATIPDQFDFVIMTGDIPAHNVWNQSRSDQINAIRTFTKMFADALPGKNLYFTVGNHESAPVNSYPPPFITGNNSIEWLYSALAESWGLWLPGETVETIMRGAFYTVSPYPGFRIVSINMNYCNKGNWWLMINSTDPAGQLQWLISVLQTAEDKHEKVFMLGHIPNGGGTCLKAFSWNYYKIVSRYESTIVAQFFGHRHTDDFEMFYDDVTFKRPLSVGYIPGSVTTNKDLNPGYRIYEMDGNYANSSWQLRNFDNYILNISAANSGTVKWTHEYNARTAYNMPSIFPADWDRLINRMETDDALLQLFYKYKGKSNDVKHCDAACKKKLICSLRKGRSHDSKTFC